MLRKIVASGQNLSQNSNCHKHTLIDRFVARDGEQDFLEIWPGEGGCYAIVPYWIDSGRNEIGLEQNGCVYMKVRSNLGCSSLRTDYRLSFMNCCIQLVLGMNNVDLIETSTSQLIGQTWLKGVHLSSIR